jgi:prepilin-type N-terminal cleavage/methylation domain-containing protein
MIRSNGRNSHRMRLLARVASAFTFVEVMVVVIIIGVLAAIVIPQFGGVTEDAKASACEGGLAGVRSAIRPSRNSTPKASWSRVNCPRTHSTAFGRCNWCRSAPRTAGA